MSTLRAEVPPPIVADLETIDGDDLSIRSPERLFRSIRTQALPDRVKTAQRELGTSSELRLAYAAPGSRVAPARGVSCRSPS